MAPSTPTRPVRYDADVARDYAAMIGETVRDPATAALLDLLGDVSGKRVLDLPCGEGRVARELARRGAQVVAVDLSPSMLERALDLEKKEPLGISYLNTDGTSPDALEGESFDLVVCNFGLSDIDDFEGVLTTFHRVLQTRGTLVYSIMHPCFPGWGTALTGDWPPGGSYFEELWWPATDGPAHDPRYSVGTNHRMLATYFNTFAQRGFALEQVAEPEPGAEFSMPEAKPVPMYLVARYRKP